MYKKNYMKKYRKRNIYKKERAIYDFTYVHTIKGRKVKNETQEKYIDKKNARAQKKFLKTGCVQFSTPRKLLDYGIEKLEKFVCPWVCQIYIGFTHAHSMLKRRSRHLSIKEGYTSFTVFAKFENAKVARLLEKLIVNYYIKKKAKLFNKIGGGGGAVQYGKPGCCYFCTKLPPLPKF
jgi:hypothetical protein